MRNFYCLLLLVPLMVSVSLNAQQQQQPRQLRVMPYPASVQLGDGEFVVDRSLTIALTGHKEPRLERAVNRFVRTLSLQTGMNIPVSLVDEKTTKLLIHCDRAGEKVQELGEDESYKLEVTPATVRLSAATPLGVLRGLETLLQMVTPASSGFSVPVAVINDQPRFPWRGLLIDSCRHWMPVETVKAALDGMAAVKMNVLHWHLSEDQGFRVESKKYPKLHQMGSDGNYYTQDQIREIIDHARDRGIRVVPEFDMPGHSIAWFVGYPELASAPGPYQVERKWGIFDAAMDPTRDSTYKFLENFIGEMAKLFPDKYFHIGGDEVTGKHWTANTEIQQFMREHQLKDNHSLQAYFNKRVQKIVSKHDKIMMGWDEVLHPDLPRDIVVQSWRGPKSLAAAARQGYRSLLSSGYYMDMAFPAARHYAVEPLSGDAASLTPEEQKQILGGEACMWAEFVTPETIGSRLWPRTAAVAERLWSPQQVTDVNAMYDRLDALSSRLTHLGLDHESNYIPMLQRISGRNDVDALKLLADVVEPVKEYTRPGSRKYTQFTPLNRLVDAARPESLKARAFSLRIERFIAGKPEAEDEQQIRSSLTAWRDNHRLLAAQANGSFLMQEVLPLSQELSQVAAIGLEALDSMKSGIKPSDQWRAEKLAILGEAKKPKSELLNMIVAPVEALVKTTAR